MAEVGQVLADRYELVESIGRGGMAEVFRATDRVLKRDVAVKVLAGHRAGDESFRLRFRREARAAASLNHPNVVTVHDTGSDGDSQYIVMELLSGSNLKQLLASEGALDPARAVAITEQICQALAAAHAEGLVHRDIKPGNIMFDATDTVKVADFGIVHAVEATATATDSVYGSAPYISPEQAGGEQVDGRSDLYSLGCVLYTMLAGRRPFNADQPAGVVYQHLHAHPDPPSRVNPRVPAGLDDVVFRAMGKQPGDRFAGAAEMSAALIGAARAAGLDLDGESTRRLEADGDAATVAVGAGAAAAADVDAPTALTGAATPAASSGGEAAGAGGPMGRGDGRDDGGRRLTTMVLGGGLLLALLVAWLAASGAGTGPDDGGVVGATQSPTPVTATTQPARPTPSVTPSPTPSVPTARADGGEETGGDEGGEDRAEERGDGGPPDGRGPPGERGEDKGPPDQRGNDEDD